MPQGKKKRLSTKKLKVRNEGKAKEEVRIHTPFVMPVWVGNQNPNLRNSKLSSIFFALSYYLFIGKLI